MIEVYKNAKALPAYWDMAAENNFALYKNNLNLLERVNPCNQTYVIFKNDEKISIMVLYEIKINIFCYSRWNLFIPIKVIGIPCSVSEPGYSINCDNKAEIYKYLRGLKGGKLILNAYENLEFLGFAKGYTLPTCIMMITWNTFEEYLKSLRSHYRYRYLKAIEKAKGLLIEQLTYNTSFNEKHYSLYEMVYNKSEYKLEKLTIDFFKESEASIIEFKLLDEPIAFVQYLIVKKKMVFLFGGLNYSLNKEYDLYLNMLLTIVKIAIKNDCVVLNLGQTAEEIKCRLGAFCENKYLYMHHSSKLINMLISNFNKFFSYKMKKIKFTVLKR